MTTLNDILFNSSINTLDKDLTRQKHRLGIAISDLELTRMDSILSRFPMSKSAFIRLAIRHYCDAIATRSK